MLTKLKNFLSPPASPDDTDAIEWAHQYELTPDMWKVGQFIRQLIFVPCDMKAGLKNHSLIEEAINGPVFPDVYTAKEYTFWKKDLGGHSFPVALPADYRPNAFTPDPVESAPIKGELYFIPGEHLGVLDNHRMNGLQFTRERVPIRISYRAVRYLPKDILRGTPLSTAPEGTAERFPSISPHCFYTVTAWMYLGITEYWDPMIGGVFNSQMKLYEHDTPRAWIKKYYKFDG